MSEHFLAKGADRFEGREPVHLVELGDDGDDIAGIHGIAFHLGHHLVDFLLADHCIKAVGAGEAVGAVHAVDMPSGDAHIDTGDGLVDHVEQFLFGGEDAVDGLLHIEDLAELHTVGGDFAMAADFYLAVFAEKAHDH